MNEAKTSDTFSSVLPPQERIRLGLFVVISLIAAGVGFLWLGGRLAGEAMRYSAYWCLLGTTLAWGAALLTALRSEFRWRRDMGWEPLAWAGGLLVLAIGAEPAGHKVVLDEFVLQATAWHLHVQREAAVPVRAFVVDGVMLPIDSYVDKRPAFFPFVVSVVHAATGYRVNNAFWVNGALLVVHLLIVWRIVAPWLGLPAARLAMLLWASVPLLVQNARGAGMDMLNLVLIEAAVLIGRAYLRTPTASWQSALMLHVVLLAQTRYESALFVGTAFAVILVSWWREKRISVCLGLLLTPVLLLPYAWQHRLVAESPHLWELPPGLVQRFGWQHVEPHVREAIAFLFAFKDPQHANSALVAALGFVGLAFAVVHAARLQRTFLAPGRVTAVTPIIAFGFGVAVNAILLMFYYWGRFSDPVAARLALPLLAWLVFSATWLCARLGRLERYGRWLYLGIVLFLIGVTRPQMAEKHYTDHNLTAQEFEWERSVINRLPPSPRLIVSNKSSLPWIIRGQPALHIEYARQRVREIEYHWVRRTFPEVLITQFLQATDAEEGLAVPPEQRLPGATLAPVAERRFGARLIRISRVVAFSLPETP